MGMNRRGPYILGQSLVFPAERGDEPNAGTCRGCTISYSPHARGCGAVHEIELVN